MSTYMEQEQWDKIAAKGHLDKDDHRGVTDWEMRYRKGNDSKYGSSMYSPSLDIFRHRTFSEFYGGGIVD